MVREITPNTVKLQNIFTKIPYDLFQWTFLSDFERKNGRFWSFLDHFRALFGTVTV